MQPVGKKQIFLPAHVVTFLRPKPGQPANHALFAVPLKWNKFDLRDYLYHAYGVEVRGVRSFINQKMPERKNGVGKFYRPQPEKRMVAELVKPFVWPKVLPEDERERFDYTQFKNFKGAEDKRIAQHERHISGKIPLRTEQPIPEDMKGLRKQVAEIMADPESWQTKGVKGSKWREIETETESQFDFEGGEHGELVKHLKEQEKGGPSER